jgi:hypothetical protein
VTFQRSLHLTRQRLVVLSWKHPELQRNIQLLLVVYRFRLTPCILDMIHVLCMMFVTLQSCSDIELKLEQFRASDVGRASVYIHGRIHSFPYRFRSSVCFIYVPLRQPELPTAALLLSWIHLIWRSAPKTLCLHSSLAE